MFTIEVAGKEYKLRYGYGVLGTTDLIDRMARMDMRSEVNIQEMFSLVGELILAGLQRYHRDEFGYDTPNEKSDKLDDVFDLMDAYDEEGTEENPQNCYDLFVKIQKELMENGFLSGAAKAAKKVKREED